MFHFRLWHQADVSPVSRDFRFRGLNEHHKRGCRLPLFDPERTSSVSRRVNIGFDQRARIRWLGRSNSHRCPSTDQLQTRDFPKTTILQSARRPKHRTPGLPEIVGVGLPPWRSILIVQLIDAVQQSNRLSRSATTTLGELGYHANFR